MAAPDLERRALLAVFYSRPENAPKAAKSGQKRADLLGPGDLLQALEMVRYGPLKLRRGQGCIDVPMVR